MGHRRRTVVRESKGGGKDVSGLLCIGWWRIYIPTSQVVVMINTFIRAKYMYGLTLRGARKEIKEDDERWYGMAMKALLKTRTNITGKGMNKVIALLQIQEFGA